MNRFMLTLAVVLVASIAGAQAPEAGGPLAGPGLNLGAGPLQLATRDLVQTELALSQGQIAKIAELDKQIQEERRSLGIQRVSVDLITVPPEEQLKRIAELEQRGTENQKKLDAKFKPKLAEILREDQAKRLDEIVVQARGIKALLDPDVARRLDLSKEQTENLVSIAIGSERKAAEERFATQGRINNIGEIIDNRNKEMLNVLTADQRAKYEEAKGKPFDVRPLRSGIVVPPGPIDPDKMAPASARAHGGMTHEQGSSCPSHFRVTGTLQRQRE